MLRRVTSKRTTTGGSGRGRGSKSGKSDARVDPFFPSQPSVAATAAALVPSSSENDGTSDMVVERVRLTIQDAHVFKLPPKPNARDPWRGADWIDKVWQGTLKVVERIDQTAVLLVDAPPSRTHTNKPSEKENVFAVCPILDELMDCGADDDEGKTQHRQPQQRCVDRCVDSSRYFVLRIESSQGRHMFIGLAFNERNDAFDFNIALEDSRREKQADRKAARNAAIAASGIYENEEFGTGEPATDYRIKEGEKIKVVIPRKMMNSRDSQEEEVADDLEPGSAAAWGGLGTSLSDDGSSGTSAAERRREARKARAQSKSGSAGGGGFLKPPPKDTPSRLG